MFFCILKDQRETLWRSSPQLEGFLDVDGRLVTQCHTRDELIFDVVFQHVFNVFDFTAAKFQWRPLLLSFGLAHNAHGTQQWSQPWHRHQPPQLVPWAALLPRDLDELTEKKRNEEILKRFWKELKRKNEKFCKKKEFNSAVGLQQLLLLLLFLQLLWPCEPQSTEHNGATHWGYPRLTV